MKILYLTEFFPTNKQNIKGGVEARSFFLLKELDKINQYYIVASSEKGEKKSSKIFTQSKIFKCGKKNGLYLHDGGLWQRFLFVISGTIKALNIIKEVEIIEASGWMGCAIALILKTFTKKPIVITYHEVWIDQWEKIFGFNGKIGKCLEKKILKQHWTKIIAVSKKTKNDLQKYSPKNDVTVIYNGIEKNDIFEKKIEKYFQPTICTVARLVTYKRISDLIMAMPEIKKNIFNIKLLIIGEGSEKNNLHALVKKLQLEKNVEFLGYIESHDDVLWEIKKSHIFCLPTEKEGFGIATIEAIGCKTPYVVSDIDVNKEITNNGEGGILYPVGNIQQLAGAVLGLLKNTKKYNQKIQEEKSLIKRYQWHEITIQMNMFYKKICK